MNESELNELKAKAFAKMAELKAGRDVADTAMQKLAHELPPLTMKEVCPDRCNINDRTIRSDIARFMDRYTRIDTSLLDTGDFDKWELLTGSDRYEVREVPDPEYDEGTDYLVYQVWDTDAQEVVDTEYDEDKAERACDELNLEDQREHLYGFPVRPYVGLDHQPLRCRAIRAGWLRGLAL